MFRYAKKFGCMLTCLVAVGCSPFEESRPQPQVVPGPYSNRSQNSNPNQLRPGVNPQQQVGGAVVPPSVVPPSTTSNINGARSFQAQQGMMQQQQMMSNNAPFNPMPPANFGNPQPAQFPGQAPPLNNNTGFNNSQYSTPIPGQPNQ